MHFSLNSIDYYVEISTISDNSVKNLMEEMCKYWLVHQIITSNKVVRLSSP